MSDSDERQQLVRSAIASLQQRTSFSRQLQKKVSEHQREVSKADAEYRQQISEKIHKAAGIDSSEILRRQKLQDSSAKKFLDSLIPDVAKNSKAVKARHEARFKWMSPSPVPWGPQAPPPAQPLPHPQPLPQLPVSAVLTEAFSVDFGGGYLAAVPNGIMQLGSISTDGWNNLARIRIGETTPDNFYSCGITFYWMPPRDGWLDVTAFVLANGSHWWSTQHNGVNASVQHTAYTALSTLNLGDKHGTSDQFFLNFSLYDFPGSGTDTTGIGVIDQFLTLELSGNTSVRITGNSSVYIIIYVELDVQNQEADSAIDFYTDDQSINVPAVFLTLR